MTNPFYSHNDGVPAAQTRGTSSLIRNEFDLIQAGFDTLAAYFGGVTGAILVTGVNGGAANAYTLTPTTALAAYRTNMLAIITPSATNTLASTVNISALGAVSVLTIDGSALSAGDLVTTVPTFLIHDGTAFRIFSVTKRYVDAIVAAEAASRTSADALKANIAAQNYGAGLHDFSAGTIRGATPVGASDLVTKSYADLLPFGGVDPIPVADAGGTANAITATFSPAITLSDKQKCMVVTVSANSSLTPTFSPNGLTARTITMNGGLALQAGSIAGNGYVMILEYNLANTRWELLNPVAATGVPASLTNITASSTLSSVSYHTVAMTSIGQAISLPAANTLSVSSIRGVFENKAAYPFGLRDNAGTLIGVVGVGGTGIVDVSNVGSAAGVWQVTGSGLESGFIVNDNLFSSTYNSGNIYPQFVAFDANTSMHFVQIAGGSTAAAFIVDNVGKVLTTPTSLEAGAVIQAAFKITSTTAIVFYRVSTTAKAVVITLSGSTPSFVLTVGTLQASAVSWASTGWNGEDSLSAPCIAQYSTTLYVCSGKDIGGSNLLSQAISVSGATVTIGAVNTTAISTTLYDSVTTLPVTSTTGLVVYGMNDGATNNTEVRILSVSGTTVTANTPASVANTSQTTPHPVCINSTTKALVTYVVTNTLHFGVVTISGNSVAFNDNPFSVPLTTANVTYSSDAATRNNPHLIATSATTARYWANSQLTTLGSILLILTISGTTVSGQNANAGLRFSMSDTSTTTASGYGVAACGSDTAEWLGIRQYGVTGAWKHELIGHKINGTAITVGDTLSVAPSTLPTAIASAVLSTRLSGGDYLVTSNNGTEMVVVRDNGEKFWKKGSFNIPNIQGITAIGIQPVWTKRVVMIGQAAEAQTTGVQNAARLIHMEIV